MWLTDGDSPTTRMWGWLTEGKGHTYVQEVSVQEQTLLPRNHTQCAMTGGEGCRGAVRDAADTRGRQSQKVLHPTEGVKSLKDNLY